MNITALLQGAQTKADALSSQITSTTEQLTATVTSQQGLIAKLTVERDLHLSAAKSLAAIPVAERTLLVSVAAELAGGSVVS